MRYLRIAGIILCALLPGGLAIALAVTWYERKRAQERTLRARREWIVANILTEKLGPWCDPDKDTLKLTHPEVLVLQ